MIRIAIVEDDKNYIIELKNLLSKYEQESNQKLIITVFEDGEDIVTDYKADYDIILMDIEMHFMDGMTAATKIREKDSEVVLIFITNMPQYVMEGYKVDALDYVLKPLSYFALSQRIVRAIGRMKNRSISYISVMISNGVQKIDISKIYYIEVQNHDVIFHTVNGIYTTKLSLRVLEKRLENESFFRCHKSFIVNLAYVDSIQNNDININNQIVQVSRGRKKEFVDALNNYFNEVSK